MSLDVAHCAPFAIHMRVFVIISEACDSCGPVFVWQARLKEQAPRTFDYSAVRSLYLSICVRAMWVGRIMPDSECAAYGM